MCLLTNLTIDANLGYFAEIQPTCLQQSAAIIIEQVIKKG